MAIHPWADLSIDLILNYTSSDLKASFQIA